ncbi:hypothetical protein ACA604_15915, partial [Lactiplantibacillus pentosus]|uniref:hypothetical protein n=1 Tax=Lactiplantibacillus pentosus TaxID=1589 RepID=UPI003C173C30
RDGEPLPDKYSVTTFIRSSKLNFDIVKPPRLDLVSNLRGSLYLKEVWVKAYFFDNGLFPSKSKSY